MRGTAEIRVVAHVEMDGGESAHLQSVIHKLRSRVASRSKTVSSDEAITPHDEHVLDNFNAALDEANEQAQKEFQRLRPYDEVTESQPAY